MPFAANVRPVAVVAGAGPGNGNALAKRFAHAGYAVALLARDRAKVEALAADISNARGYACDVGDGESVTHAFASIRADLGEIDALLFNAGSALFGDVETITPEQFESAWRINALGSLLCAQQVIPAMTGRGRGNIVFVGATASRRGNVQTAAFAPAKAAQRSLAESMARHLWPKGVHVALAIIDGVVDTPAARTYLPDRANETFVSPDAVAESIYALTTQDPRGWSFEVEVRPSLEAW
ncbi:NAD(P)-dependent dehydrogenase (short-subunit alcohol dehydrogenase family) [Rhodoblastus acidophilus]|uniref:SDR family NAD(P)-dependent oxidoreductase n=1 Tax=Rhodoblastus acidophilus TaxID=1074 RepID=UPI002223FCF7|nr:SDR family NAD(P)-dependent oxidoreductase [Rhodoblastus acidophilus]MCW2319002.1 NAD(P)-dependent dehydrogenase (short-subunit alcohol dehydrogenase family) [Rhodoblastus acidophilus]